MGSYRDDGKEIESYYLEFRVEGPQTKNLWNPAGFDGDITPSTLIFPLSLKPKTT